MSRHNPRKYLQMLRNVNKKGRSVIILFSTASAEPSAFMSLEIEIDPLKFERTQEVYRLLNITRGVWCEKTGFSEDQWYRWHNEENSSRPDARQFCHMCERLDINPNYLWFGYMPIQLSELGEIIEIWERSEETRREWDKEYVDAFRQRFIKMLDQVEQIESRVALSLHDDFLEEFRILSELVDSIHKQFVEVSPTTHRENWEMVRDMAAKVDVLMQRTK